MYVMKQSVLCSVYNHGQPVGSEHANAKTALGGQQGRGTGGLWEGERGGARGHGLLKGTLYFWVTQMYNLLNKNKAKSFTIKDV